VKRSTIAGAITWILAELIMVVWDPHRSWIGPAMLGYVLLLWLVVAAIVPEDKAAEQSTLAASATGARLWLRYGIVLATLFAVFMVYSVWYGGYVRLPWLGGVLRGYNAFFGLTFGQPLFNFTLYAVLPGTLLFALGMHRNEVGLTRPAPYTWRAALPCLALPAVFVALALYRGTLSVGFLATLVVRNFFSNGFSEEFLICGMTLSHLRASMRTPWALFAQAVVFSLLHYGAVSRQEHGNAIMIVANVIAENFPMAFALGLVALRTRSLALPTVLRISFDMMGNFVGL